MYNLYSALNMADNYSFFPNEAIENVAGEEHSEASEIISATVVFVILSFLFSVTMAFEYGKEHLLEHTSPRLIPIVETLFSELTVLGFLEKEELTEVLETIHYTLFGVMLIFVLEVLLLIHAGNYLEAEWLEMNDDVQSPGYRERTEKELETVKRPKWYSRGKDRIKWERLISGMIFNSLRTEFILGCHVLAPFSRLPSSEQLKSDFRFDRYLTLSLSHTIQHIIEVPNTTWLFMWGVVGLHYILMLAINNNMWVMAWIWLGLGFLLGAGMSKFYSYFIYQVLIGMVHPGDVITEVQNTRANILNNIVTGPERVGCFGSMCRKTSDANLSEKESLMKDCEDITNYDDSSNGMMGPSTLKRHLPLWCTFDLPHPNQQPLIMKKMMGFHPNRQQLLFPFQEHGPHMNVFALRLILLGQAVYGAVMLFVFADSVWIHSNLMVLIFYLALGVIPIVFIGLNLAKIVQYTVLVNNIGCHRSEKFVASVVRDQKASRALRTLMLLNKLRIRGLTPSGVVEDECGLEQADGSISASHYSIAKAVRQRRLEFWGIQEDNGTFKLEHIAEELLKRGIDSKTIVEISEMFDAYDVDKSGTLDTDETIALISAMGHPVDELRAQEIMLHLDLDNDGIISRDEFIAWNAENIIKQVEGETPISDEDMVQGLFKLFDKDGSGEITVEEFKTGLDNLKAGLSTDEIVDLMKEIDHTPDGRISEYEFERLFVRHCSASSTSH